MRAASRPLIARSPAVGLAVGLAVVAGCTRTTTNAVDNVADDPSADELPGALAARSDTPFIRGPITSIESTNGGVRILVQAAPKQPNGEPAAWVGIGAATLVWRDGAAATTGDLKKGRKVVVWITGPVLESFPVQTTASAILIDR